jgi:LAO/AO transport system ATPase
VPDPLVQKVADHDRLALARLLTLAARGEARERIAQAIGAGGRCARVVAITGSGGVGKSTLIGKLIEVARSKSETVAVLACDPQSSLTGGALLGDRIRMPTRPDDLGVFIRSVATPSGHSGIAPNIEIMVRLLAQFGFSTILLETVGAGQSDTAVRDVADVVVVLVQPETGDELQWEKAGQLEIADVVVVHKADLPGADRVEAQLREQINLPGCRAVPVIRVSSSRGEGLEELWLAIESVAPQEMKPQISQMTQIVGCDD